jgi:D-lactate dehydrogenase
MANHFNFFERASVMLLRTGFFFNRFLGSDFMARSTSAINKIVPVIPVWSNQIRKPGKKIKALQIGKSNQQVIYFSSCISRIMGGETSQQFLSVCRKANIDVVIPANLKGTCCGQIFSSKGYIEAFRQTANQTISKLWESSDEGRIPVILDVSSCTQTIKSYQKYLTNINRVKFEKMKVMDVIDFAAEQLLPRLQIVSQKEKVVFHPVCSVFKMGSLTNLEKIGNACSKQADIPFFSRCCGMAGDRGFYFPHLTASATKIESQEVNQTVYDGYYSSSRTCEMALSQAVGKNYDSILKLLDEVSEPGNV